MCFKDNVLINIIAGVYGLCSALGGDVGQWFRAQQEGLIITAGADPKVVFFLCSCSSVLVPSTEPRPDTTFGHCL